MSSDEQQNSPASVNAAEEAKKRSAYHYWHGDVDNKKKTGDVAPMPVHVALASAKVEIDTVQYKVISKYSWCDNEKTVDIYVDWPELNADSVSVEFGDDSLCAKIAESATVCHRLNLKLSKAIVAGESKFRCKPAQLAIKVKKETLETWFELEAKPNLDF
jgi:hypothetical protein